MRRIKTAHKEAATPIIAYRLLPWKGWLKSSKVTLNMIKAKAKNTSMLVKIFIIFFLFLLKI
jgi:hypothetical protein